jgi:hypothetical protein
MIAVSLVLQGRETRKCSASHDRLALGSSISR